jgi:hypothetical protein
MMLVCPTERDSLCVHERFELYFFNKIRNWRELFSPQLMRLSGEFGAVLMPGILLRAVWGLCVANS